MRWVPLEANPEIFQEWTGSLGLKPSQATFCDIYGLDPELLTFVPRPVYAVLMLFPVTEAYRKAKEAKEEATKDVGVPDVMFFKQTINNACGTMGILHAVANMPIDLDGDSALAKIFKECKPKTPYERAAYLESSSAIEAAHSEAAQGGQTAAPDVNDDTDLHFTCFVEAEGHIVELDGSREAPLVHGKVQGDLLESAVEVVKGYMAVSDSIQFNLIALTRGQ